MKQLVLDIAPPASPALDNFVPGRNAELVQTLRGLVDAQSAERCVFLWGAAHSGRSHLLQAVVHGYRERGRSASYHACTEALVQIPRQADFDCAAFDDVEHLDEQAQIALFTLYNRVREGGGVLLVSGNAVPTQLGLRVDLVTRLSWGLVYQVHGLSDEEKAQALEQYAAERGLPLPKAVIEYLLRHAQRDMRSLLATLDTLDRHSLATKRPITVPMLRELLHAAESG